MCYSIPGKVIAVKAGRAIIDYFGEKREAHTDTEGVEVGDCVLAQGGVVVETVPTSWPSLTATKHPSGSRSMNRFQSAGIWFHLVMFFSFIPNGMSASVITRVSTFGFSVILPS